MMPATPEDEPGQIDHHVATRRRKGSQLSKEALRGVGIKVALNVCRHVVVGEIDCAGKQFRAPVGIGEDCTSRFGLVGDMNSTKRRGQFDGSAATIPEALIASVTNCAE
jgi:hypothetical protein